MPHFLRALKAAVILRVLAVIVCFGAVNVGSASAFDQDPAPPQIAVTYNFKPSPLAQYHGYKLVYEMQITSFTSQPYELESVEADAGSRSFAFDGVRLTRMLRTVGVNEFSATNNTIAPGTTAIVYFTLAFDRAADIPAVITHTLTVRFADGSRHTLQVDPLAVGLERAVVVGAPLRGADWIAADATHNGSFNNLLNAPLDAAHRRTILLENGNVYLAQRYAIDWVKYRIIKGLAQTYSGPVHENSSYFCYDEPIYNVAAGRIVQVLDGVKENVPNSGTFAESINFINAGGNHVIVDIGNGRYAFYAHMIPGSMPSYVKVGAYVGSGTVLGHVGNSGSSTEPHLHFHIVDKPSFIGANGLPYEISQFSGSAENQSFPGPDGTQYFPHLNPEQRLTNDYPANNAAVTF
jgi:murein DD-endopeptidase MepM/ murein hydrolase activator NlpD